MITESKHFEDLEIGSKFRIGQRGIILYVKISDTGARILHSKERIDYSSFTNLLPLYKVED